MGATRHGRRGRNPAGPSGAPARDVRLKSGDLQAAGLQATLDPSAMTLGGMLKHLARFEDDMSSEWLHGRGQLPPWNAVDWSADPAWDWRTAADDSPDQLYALWRDAVVRSRALFAAAMAEGGSARRPDGPDSPALSLRYILLNMIEEYARHNGHADLIRDSINRDAIAGLKDSLAIVNHLDGAQQLHMRCAFKQIPPCSSPYRS